MSIEISSDGTIHVNGYHITRKDYGLKETSDGRKVYLVELRAIIASGETLGCRCEIEEAVLVNCGDPAKFRAEEELVMLEVFGQQITRRDGCAHDYKPFEDVFLRCTKCYTTIGATD